MFGLFKKKSKLEKLQEQYKKLLEESYKLSTTNRSESDKKQAEAQAILDQIDILKQGE
ncbi:Lacal_2735 family protein [Lacinutrix neustonica]|uniref:Lacal_2735 family protein n=1 Tax=Lacinutrix neustonica TaxID=2980107 RepID=A0A9E8N0P7_9FLAO|nr:Lacal_2735 family protein [Lacinutrix neustonica]WAC03942.1 Lacal_2735 family protein [Lacinutrix neustonica]